MAVESADELYGVPLERFVPERTALVRALRADGRREEATRAAAMRKPSVAAWAVNQLVRTQPAAMNELLSAGDAARKAQSDLIAGRGDGNTLRKAAHRQRSAVDALVDLARGLLTSEGHELSATMLERVADTLQAAALDEQAREEVGAGRLERELKHVGLPGGAGAGPAPGRRAGKARQAGKASPGGKRQAGEIKGAERRREAPDTRQAAAQARQAAEARKAARSAEAEARRRLERAERKLQVLEAKRDSAAQALEEAEGALAEARAELEAASEELDQAKARRDAR